MVAEQTQVWYRVSRRSRCKMCGGAKYCEVSADGRTVHCMKVGDGPESPYRGGGWYHQQDGVQVGPLTEPEPQPERGDADLLHRVYRCVLDNAPLSAEHRTYIDKCGLPADAPTHGFGTLTPERRNAVVGALLDRFTEDELLSVPGIVLEEFKRQQTGKLTFTAFGMLVAVTDVGGRIVGMQVRIGPGDYRWLSGCGGASSGAPVHVARPSVLRDQRVCVVESPKTASVLAERLGAIVIGLAGFGNWRAIQPTLEALATEAESLVIALDAADPDGDEMTAKRLANAGTGLAALAVAIGYGVRIANWPYEAGKGPDDVLVNGNTWTLTVYKPTSTPVEGDEPAVLGKNADALMAKFRAEAAAMSRSRLEQEYVRTVYNGQVTRDYLQIIGRIASHQTMREPDKGGKGKRGGPLLTATDRVNGINLVFLLRDKAHAGLCTDLTAICRDAVSDLGCTSVSSVTQSTTLLSALNIVVQKEAESERGLNLYRLPDVMPSNNPQDIDASALEPSGRKRRRTMRPCPECQSLDLEEVRTRRIICRGCGCIVSEHEDFKKVNGPDPDRERLAARDRAAARKHRGHSDWDAAMVPASDDEIEGTPSDPLVLHITPQPVAADEAISLHSTRSGAENEQLGVVIDDTGVNVTGVVNRTGRMLSVVNDNTRVRRGPPAATAKTCACGTLLHWTETWCDDCRNEATSANVGGW
jgi:hypothetical protein